MPEIPAVAVNQFGVFTRSQALEWGWTRSSVAHGIREGRIVCIRLGIYAGAEAMAGTEHAARRRQVAARSAAAVLSQSGSVASHRGAAVLAGLPVLTLPTRACVSVVPSGRRSTSDVHVHRAQLNRPHDVVLAKGIERTSSARTVVDIAREYGIDEAVVVGDAALRLRMTDPAQLSRALTQAGGWPGINRARAAVELCRIGSESPLESISRLRIAEMGLPLPVLQAEILNLQGQFLGRTDFLWEKYGVVGEADGEFKYDESSALRREKRRQEELERTGLIVIRWGWADLQNPAELYDRLRRALARGASRPASERRWIVR